MSLFNLIPEKLRQKIVYNLKKVRKGLSQETVETKEMLKVYLSFTQGTTTQEEMREANEQFRDLLKSLGLGIFAILPFSPITLPLIVKLGKKFGIDVIPSSFKSDREESGSE